MASLAFVGLVLFALLHHWPGATKANFDRIEIGMTQIEVESILGPAALLLSAEQAHLIPGWFECEWNGIDGRFLVVLTFDKSKLVADKQWHGPRERPVSFRSRVEQWIPEKWRPEPPPIPGR